MQFIRPFRPLRFAVFMTVAFAITPGAFAARPETPVEAKLTEEIVAAAELRKGFGKVETASFLRPGRHLFAVWYCPFAGRNACYLHAYYFDFATQKWIRFIDQLVEGSHTLSAEMPEGETKLIFRGSAGQVAVEKSVADLPREK